MDIKSETDIKNAVAHDPWMMDVLQAAEQLDLPNWWIGAGFLRNKIWDELEGNDSRPSKDVDLVYFDAKNTRPETDWSYDKQLKLEFPFAEWEVRNQARMHYVNNFDPYISTEDGIAHWVETATCIAVRLQNGSLQLLFCHGMGDLLSLIARPSPYMKGPEFTQLFYDRIKKKHWRERWPHLQVIANN